MIIRTIWLIIIFIISLFVIGGLFILQDKTIIQAPEHSDASRLIDISLPAITKQNSSQKLIAIEKNTLLDVPFTVQAPSAQWDNIVFQNACEEASIVMAMSWVDGRPLSKERANREIAKISSFEQENYGHFHDRSAFDTTQLIKDYFDYQNVEFRADIAAGDIKAELAKGNLIIVPLNGQKLNNPFFVPPGPLEHMLVVIGYDAKTKEFITNDPGTKRGESMRYPENVLELALQDYPTGFHEPITEINKVMIVVRPRS